MNDSCKYLLKADFIFGAKWISSEFATNLTSFTLVGGGFSGAQGGETQKQESRSEVSEVKKGYYRNNQIVEFQGILPVFIKQIHAQKEDLIKMWGFDFKMINTVAIVREIDHSSTKITYTLSDITGNLLRKPNFRPITKLLF